ncbi:MAG: dipeptide epimerase [Dictyoglomaceae bacterium]|nr:dipeptide epimerase [Dictyoglomaceae bacterium]
MDIVDLKVIAREYKYKEPFRIATGVRDRELNLEIEITLKDGTKGVGEASSVMISYLFSKDSFFQLEKTLRDILIGENILKYKTLLRKLKTLSFLPSVMAGAEYAIISALCNLKDIPPYIFFGGEKEVIESDRSIGIDSFENMIEKAKEYFKEGFNLLKIKVGLDLEEDLRKVIEIQKILPSARFIVDANQGFDVKSAIIFAKELYKEGVKVEIFEQPVLKTDIEGLKLVRFHSPFPVAGDESVYTIYDGYRLIKEDCIDFINIKLMKSGIYDALGLIELARAGNKGLMIGCMGESSLGISQSVHFTAGTGAFSYCDLDSHLLIEEESFRGSFIQEGEKIKVK